MFHHHFHHKPFSALRGYNVTVNICCRVDFATRAWSQAEEQQGHSAGSDLEAFHHIATLHLPHFAKLNISSH